MLSISDKYKKVEQKIWYNKNEQRKNELSKDESVYIYAHQWSKWKMAHKINHSVFQSVYQIFFVWSDYYMFLNEKRPRMNCKGNRI